jgi:hypothetical protein
MKRQDLSKLSAWLIAFCRDSSVRRSAQDSTAETSPVLMFVAVSLFLILAILEIDLHRDELRLLGIIFGEDGVDPVFRGL